LISAFLDDDGGTNRGAIYLMFLNDPSHLLVVKGLATNPNNDLISYKIVVTDSIRKGSMANSGDVISADGKTLDGTILPQNGHDSYFVTGDVSVEAPVDLDVTLDGVPIPVITPEKFLVVKGLATNPNNGMISYKVVVTDSIRKGSAANSGDVISADGKTLDGTILPKNGHDSYFVTGDIVSVEAPVDLDVTLDGVPIPVIITSTEKSLVVKGLATNPNNALINYKVVVTDSIRKGSMANSGDVISADGKTLDGTILPQTGHDSYFVTGDVVSVEAPVDLAVTLDGVPIPVIITIQIMT